MKINILMLMFEICNLLQKICNQKNKLYDFPEYDE